MDVKSLCLGVLTFGDMAGYDIKKYFEESFSHFYVAGYGSIYPALAALTRDGLVSVTSVAQEKRPHKKVYSLTPAGRKVLEEALLATRPHHKVRSNFLVLMYFAHLLPPVRLMAVIDERIDEWEAVLAHIEAYEAQKCEVPPGVQFCIGYGRTVIGAAVEYVRQHRGLLEDALEL